MKVFKALVVLGGAAVLIAGCALPVGDDLLMTRDGNTGIIYLTDYNLQTYVPIPRTGEKPVTLINHREDLDLRAVWKDQSGSEISGLTVFAANTVYKAEIRLTPKEGYGFNPSTPFTYPLGKITTQHDDLGEPTRIVTVTYNNSDDADITFITDYNLQSYVPIPMTGEKPTIANRGDVTVGVAWEVEQPPASENYVPIPGAGTYTFEAGAVYRATISLAANSDYRFIGTRNFAYPLGTVTTQPGADADPKVRNLSAVTYMPAAAPAVIDDLNLTPYLPKPISGTVPVLSFAGSQYTGTVVWKDAGTQVVLAGPFQPGVEYTAEAALSPALGYAFTGVGQDAFVHNGAQAVSNPADSGTVRLDFSATESAGVLTVVYDTILTGRIPKPVSNGTGVKSFAGSQYTGTVSWKHAVSHAALVGPFQPGMEYTAVVTLSAAPGYTFTGLRQNAFSHGDASGAVTNPAGSGTVTINFPPIVVPVYSALTFGPYGAEGSALKVMTERSGDGGSVTIELAGGGPEVVVPSGVIFVADLNSPGNVTIDGKGRVLRLTSPGSFFTVGNGVTLTLKNITLEGYTANIAPLVEVRSRGRLILDEGMMFTGNQTTGEVGGVWVNGGELVMNEGAVIEKMSVTTVTGFSGISFKGGGVLIDNKGKFTMNGGTIGGENSVDGNTISGAQYSGGGVFVHDGSFDMYEGTIQSNTVIDPWSGAGVYVNEHGAFTMYNGTIQKNMAPATNSAGGVSNNGTFTMYDGNIQKNTTLAQGSGGGVSNRGTFTMNGGNIQKNTAGNYSGGGVLNSTVFIMNDGTIKGNSALTGDSGGGVCVVEGQFTMNGGTIGGETPDADANTAAGGANGVYVSGSFTMTGGIITGNTASGTNDYGVYADSSPYNSNIATFTMTGSARVAEANKVYLIKNNNLRPTITIAGSLSATPAANIIINSPGAGEKLLRALSAELIQDNMDKFMYDDGQSGRIDTTVSGPDSGGYYYGVYQ